MFYELILSFDLYQQNRSFPSLNYPQHAWVCFIFTSIQDKSKPGLKYLVDLEDSANFVLNVGSF